MAPVNRNGRTTKKTDPEVWKAENTVITSAQLPKRRGPKPKPKPPAIPKVDGRSCRKRKVKPVDPNKKPACQFAIFRRSTKYTKVPGECFNCKETQTRYWCKDADGNKICAPCDRHLKLYGYARNPDPELRRQESVKRYKASWVKIREQRKTGEKSSTFKINICKVCDTNVSSTWYRKSTAGILMCTRCGWYYRKHGVFRPKDREEVLKLAAERMKQAQPPKKRGRRKKEEKVVDPDEFVEKDGFDPEVVPRKRSGGSKQTPTNMQAERPKRKAADSDSEDEEERNQILWLYRDLIPGGLEQVELLKRVRVEEVADPRVNQEDLVEQEDELDDEASEPGEVREDGQEESEDDQLADPHSEYTDGSDGSEAGTETPDTFDVDEFIHEPVMDQSFEEELNEDQEADGDVEEFSSPADPQCDCTDGPDGSEVRTATPDTFDVDEFIHEPVMDQSFEEEPHEDQEADVDMDQHRDGSFDEDDELEEDRPAEEEDRPAEEEVVEDQEANGDVDMDQNRDGSFDEDDEVEPNAIPMEDRPAEEEDRPADRPAEEQVVEDQEEAMRCFKCKKTETSRWLTDDNGNDICAACNQKVYRAKKKQARKGRKKTDAQQPGPSESRKKKEKAVDPVEDEDETEEVVVAKNKGGRPRKRPIKKPESEKEEQEGGEAEEGKQPAKRKTRAQLREEAEAMEALRRQNLVRKIKEGPKKKQRACESTDDEFEYEFEAVESIEDQNLEFEQDAHEDQEVPMDDGQAEEQEDLEVGQEKGDAQEQAEESEHEDSEYEEIEDSTGDDFVAEPDSEPEAEDLVFEQEAHENQEAETDVIPMDDRQDEEQVVEVGQEDAQEPAEELEDEDQEEDSDDKKTKDGTREDVAEVETEPEAEDVGFEQEAHENQEAEAAVIPIDDKFEYELEAAESIEDQNLEFEQDAHEDQGAEAADLNVIPMEDLQAEEQVVEDPEIGREEDDAQDQAQEAEHEDSDNEEMETGTVEDSVAEPETVPEAENLENPPTHEEMQREDDEEDVIWLEDEMPERAEDQAMQEAGEPQENPKASEVRTEDVASGSTKPAQGIIEDAGEAMTRNLLAQNFEIGKDGPDVLPIHTIHSYGKLFFKDVPEGEPAFALKAFPIRPWLKIPKPEITEHPIATFDIPLWSSPFFSPPTNQIYSMGVTISMTDFFARIMHIRLNLPSDLSFADKKKEMLLEREYIWIADWETPLNFKKKLAEATGLTEEQITEWFNKRTEFEASAEPIIIEKMDFVEKMDKIAHFFDSLIPDWIYPNIADWAGARIRSVVDYLESKKVARLAEMEKEGAATSAH